MLLHNWLKLIYIFYKYIAVIFIQQTWTSRDFFLAMQFSLKTSPEILGVIQVQLQKLFSPNMY